MKNSDLTNVRLTFPKSDYALVIKIFVIVIQYLDELLTQLSDIVEKHSDVNVGIHVCVVPVNSGIFISVTFYFFSQRDSLEHVY